MIGHLPLGKEKINDPSKLKSSLSGGFVPSGTEIHLKDMLYLIRVTYFFYFFGHSSKGKGWMKW